MGGWEIFTINGRGKPGMGGGGFIMGAWEIFKVSLHNKQRGANPLFYKTPPYCLPPLHCLFLSLNEWSCHIWCATLLNDNMHLHMLSLYTLEAEGPCVFYATRCKVYWDLTHNMHFYWYSDLVSYIHKHKHIQHTQRPVDWQTHINIYLQHIMSLQQLLLLH